MISVAKHRAFNGKGSGTYKYHCFLYVAVTVTRDLRDIRPPSQWAPG